MSLRQHRLIGAVGVLVDLFLMGSGPAEAHQALDPAIVAKIPPRRGPANLHAPSLIEKGRRLFEEETFGGNGRTCATCHPPGNNFTIDVPFINSLPANDPLFVAEFDPALRDLEIPSLLRSKGLICENLDGFDRPCVLRSVPHTLALGLSRAPDRTGPFDQSPLPASTAAARPIFPLVAALGWAGDGSPGDGSLRNFAVGAVVQHFPKTLNRVDGSDFRLPTAEELDAMEAFQFSLGRRVEMTTLNPNGAGALRFTDASVAEGQNLFFNGATSPPGVTPRTCSGCHTQAGAGTPNRNRATGAERSPLAPPCLSPLVVNGDGGFGQGTGLQEPAITVNGQTRQVDQGSVVTVDRSTFCPDASGPVTFIGTTFFNPPPVVEAADTMPGFHNNFANTVEEVVEFYLSDAFNQSISGSGAAAFSFNQSQVLSLGAFLRTINALENERSAAAYLDAATNVPTNVKVRNAKLALRDIEDAINDLTTGLLAPLFPGTGVVEANLAAQGKLRDTGFGNLSDSQLGLAQADLERARNLMLQP